MSLKRDLIRVAAAIKKASKVVILTHAQPDGDAIGSALGLALILRKAGKQALVAWADKSAIPEQYAFLPGQEFLSDLDKLTAEPDLVIAIDCGAADRLGAAIDVFLKAKVSINIDHHRNNKGFAAINVVDAGYASAAEMIYELGKMLGIEPDIDIALNLYAGIVTDTGRFQYSNTTEHSFLTAAKLIKVGVDPAMVFRNVYESTSLTRLKLAARAFEAAVFDAEIGFIHTVITKEDLKSVGAGISDAENVIDSLRAVAGVRVAAVLKDTNGKLRVSLRSTGDIDVGAIAEAKGGGGHKLAAGYNTNMKPSKAIEELRQTIEEGAW